MAMYVFAVKRLSEKFVTVCRDKTTYISKPTTGIYDEKVEKSALDPIP